MDAIASEKRETRLLPDGAMKRSEDMVGIIRIPQHTPNIQY